MRFIKRLMCLKDTKKFTPDFELVFKKLKLKYLFDLRGGIDVDE
jgi:hypothetical protein